MVSSNASRLLARRASNVENAAPNQPHSALLKRAYTSVSGVVQEQTHRRRAIRLTGPSGTRAPRYMVHQSRRRAQARVPPPTQVDIVMPSLLAGDAKEEGKITTRTTVSLPRTLGRPDFKEVSNEILAKIDPGLDGMPADYIRDVLEQTGMDMLKVLASVEAKTERDVLPTQLPVLVKDLSHDMPTHMLAVHTRNASAARRKVTLYPVHNIIFASHCANLPALPESHPDTPAPGSPITLPVVPLALPNAETFPLLSAFLYTRQSEPLMAGLLPCAPPAPEENETGRALLVRYARSLAATYTSNALLQRIMTVNGLWRNVCALGVYEDGLWATMDHCWEVLLTALAISSGKLDMMIPTGEQI